jgi:hypothetical protein
MMSFGGPMQITMSPTRAAGNPPISTFKQHGGAIKPPPCGLGPSVAGQVCLSSNLAARGGGNGMGIDFLLSVTPSLKLVSLAVTLMIVLTGSSDQLVLAHCDQVNCGLRLNEEVA